MKNRSLKDIVYDAILESIYSSEYKPNEIITENSLIERFGYSKSPIREALISLCHEDILKSIPRCGYAVVALTSEDVTHMLEYRLVLETGFLRVSAPHITDEDLKKLDELDELCNKKTEKAIEHWIYNINFHTKLLSISGNPFACNELSHCMNFLWRAYAQLHWNQWNHYSLPADMKYHHLIIESLREKDIDSAVKYLESDLSDFGRQ